jgi:hypothetical protein
MRNKKFDDGQRPNIRSKEGQEYIMSTLIPGKFSTHSSGAPEMSQGDDLEAMVARLDEKWRELKKLLRAQENPHLEEMPETQIFLSDLDQVSYGEQEDAGTGKSWWNSFLPGNKAKLGVTPLETDAIIKRMEKLDEDTKIRERLAKIEKQNFNLTIYAVGCTLLVLLMVFFTYFLQDSYASSRSGLEQPVEPQIAATTETPNPAVPTSLAPQASTQPTPETPDSQKKLTGMSTPQEKETPQVEYVGSRNSNKYHYRSCKWTRYIPPNNERVFHSVAEAQKAGYIRCPTCMPPLTDEPQTSAR